MKLDTEKEYTIGYQTDADYTLYNFIEAILKQHQKELKMSSGGDLQIPLSFRLFDEYLTDNQWGCLENSLERRLHVYMSYIPLAETFTLTCRGKEYIYKVRERIYKDE